MTKAKAPRVGKLELEKVQAPDNCYIAKIDKGIEIAVYQRSVWNGTCLKNNWIGELEINFTQILTVQARTRHQVCKKLEKVIANTISSLWLATNLDDYYEQR